MPDDKELIEKTQKNETLSHEYQKIELGDTVLHSPTPPPSVPQAAAPHVTNQPSDPMAFWSQVSDTGYKPSINLIQNVSSLLSNGSVDWSDTWFSVLFQKIVRKVKYNQNQKK